MEADANAVNIKSAEPSANRAYHHGDLRDALVKAGMGLLEQRTSQQLSLREVARTVGVSATAVYRHFPDKEALMRAMAGRGFAMLGEMQAGAAAGLDQPDAFIAAGVAYVRFALRNPAVFRVMFSCPPPRDLFSEAPDEQAAPLQILRGNVAALVAPGEEQIAVHEARKIASISAWALVHGLATLLLDGMVEATDVEISAIVASWQVAPGA